MKVTIKDIAEECGVSPAAVSLTINHRPCRISEETKARILETARKYNYRPNRLAVSLLKKKTMTLGVVVPDISNPFFAQVCKGCENEAKANNYTLMIASSDEFVSNNFQYINTFIDNQVDGLVYVAPSSIGGDAIQAIYEKILEAGTPLVAVDRPLDFPKARSVTIDNIAGGYTATKHLLTLGHRRIGCLTGPLSSKTSQNRLEGYRRALAEFNVEYDPDLIMEGNFSLDSGYQAVAYMRGQSATALFCFNDMMALGAYRAIRDYKIQIPEDLSLVGYDDIFVADMLETPLTTINQPAYEIGVCAVRTLLDLIYQKHVENTVFTPTLKLRSSTCPPKQLKIIPL